MEGQSMFWGVVLKPDKRYEQVAADAFHVSKACLEPSTSDGGKITTVYLEKESDEFIICNLKGNDVLSENLDLNFNAGEKICFRAEGGATVHLTGYLVDEDPAYDDSMMGGMMGDSEDEEVEEEEEEEEEETPKLVKKRKLESNGDSPAVNSKKKKGEQPSALDKLLYESKKSKDSDVKQAQAMKKILETGKKPAGDDEDDDDEDDDDYEMDEDMEGSDGEEEESGEEEDEGEEEEDDEDSDVEEEEEESPKSTPQKTPQTKKGKKQKKDVLGAQNGTPMPKDTLKNGAKDTPKADKKDKPKETPKSGKKKDKKDQENKQVNGQEQKSPTKTPGKTPKRTLKGGIQVEDLKTGNGQEAVPGKHVGMYYKGQLKNGKVFDSCLSGKPFKFKLGKGEVIKGWEVGINGMKVGGKRRLTVPAHMAYGNQGAPPDIPPNATLTFEVECKMVN